MTRRRKILIAAITLPLLVIALLWLLPTKPPGTIPPDLQFARRTVDASQNGFDALQKAGVALNLPGIMEANLSAFAGGKQWEPDAVAEILATNQSVLAFWHEAMTRSDLQIPPIRSIDAEFPYLSDWRKTAQLALLNSARLAREGQTDAALAEALRVLEFGERIENSDGVIIHYLVGVSVKSMALENLRRLALTPGVTAAQLHPVISKLAPYGASSPGLTNVFKHEHALMLAGFADLTAGRSATSHSDRIMAKLGGRVFYDDDKTRKLTTRAARLCLQSIPLTLKETSLDELYPDHVNSSLPKTVLRGNAMGEILFGMSSTQWAHLIATKCRENSNLAATQAVLALKCFKADHGRLPAQLDELVPRYLPAIPLDDFNGQPLRYLPEKKLIYAIGRDLIDSGGIPVSAGTGTDDQVFDVEPVVPPSPAPN